METATLDVLNFYNLSRYSRRKYKFYVLNTYQQMIQAY